MDPALLADRLRGIVRVPPRPSTALPHTSSEPRLESNLEQVLGGQWISSDRGRCFVVENRIGAHEAYGCGTVGAFASKLEACVGGAALLSTAVPRLPFVFFDLETTGLSGGAGSTAFLVGCGWFDADGVFTTRQYLLARTVDERPLLEAVAHDLRKAGALVSFNGKSFDAPVLETRYAFHRLRWDEVGSRPHFDALHPARRFWAAPSAAESSCSLVTLEQHVLDVRRVGDVGGADIPWRYFQFIRTGDARPLRAVLEHNRLDLLSLAGLTARMLHLVAAGPSEARDGREMVALGRAYAAAGRDACARAALEAAIVAPAQDPGTSLEARRLLAMAERRARRFDEAARHWRAILNTPGCSARVTREASRALAVHHEHRARDLGQARAFAVRSLEMSEGAAWTEAARYRLARLDRKMSAPLLE